MAGIRIRDIGKRYGDGAGAHTALAGVSMDIREGGFVALLGPSGSGKTTVLRAIAGLETLDSGSIEIDGVEVSGPRVHVPPEQRKVAVVFQNHALWPQMTVAENVIFPLIVDRPRSAESTRRVQEALASVELEHLGGRYPDQLSGGQKQRVALARAIVGQPRVLLFDEPLASLDVALRRGMQRLIARTRNPRTSVVYVTHNQEEALALADQVAVLSGGCIHQIDTPLALSQEPATRMVAEFVGGRTVFQAEVLRDAGAGRVVLGFHGHAFTARCGELPTARSVWVSVQPAGFSCTPGAVAVDSSATTIAARVEHVFFQGDAYLAECRCVAGAHEPLTVRLPLQFRPEAGQVLMLSIDDAWVLPEPVAP